MLFLRPGTPGADADALGVIAIRLAGIERPYTRADLLARARCATVSIEIPVAQQAATGAVI